MLKLVLLVLSSHEEYFGIRANKAITGITYENSYQYTYDINNCNFYDMSQGAIIFDTNRLLK